MKETFIRPHLALLILVLLSALANAQNTGSTDDTNTKCTKPNTHYDPCAFVRAYCGDEAGLIDYLQLRYCTLPSREASFFILSAFLIVAYFYSLFRVSDVHLTTALQNISDHLRLSSEVAGLTLLSFGNGAPDLFTAFAGVSSGDFDLIFGATVGSGMFILNIVLGSIIVASYYRHKNASLSAPQHNPVEPQRPDSPRANLERRPSTSNPESFVRLRRRLQSFTRALRLKPSKEYSFSNLVVKFRGLAIDKFSHLRNLTIYTIAVVILLVIFDDGTVHWFEPVILLLYYLFFLGFFICRHFYLKKKRQQNKPRNLRSHQIALEPVSLERGTSMESIQSNLDTNIEAPPLNSTTPDLKSIPSTPVEESPNVLGLSIPRLVVTDADIGNPDASDESISHEAPATVPRERSQLLRANKPGPITTGTEELARIQNRAVPTVTVTEEPSDLSDINDKFSEVYMEKEAPPKSTVRSLWSLAKLHLYEDSDIVNSIKDSCRISKPTSVFQWIKSGASVFCTVIWIFLIPIRLLICLSMPPFLSDMISEVDDDIREEDEDNLEEIAMNSQNPEEYAEDIVSTNIIRYACGCHVEHEKQPISLSSDSIKHSSENIQQCGSPTRQGKLLTVPSSDSNVVVPSTSSTYARCMGRKDSIRCVRPSTSQRSFMSISAQSSNASDTPKIPASPELTNSVFMASSPSNSVIRSFDNATASENVRNAPWWWPLPRKAMIRFIYHLTHVPVHRFLKYRILNTTYPIVASLLVIYLAGFDLRGTGRLAILIVAGALLLLGFLVAYPILTIATDFGSGFAEYLDAKSLLSPRSSSSPTPSSTTLYSPSLNTSTNGEPISLSTDERNIARYLKFLLMAYCRGVYSESTPGHIPLRSIKIVAVLYIYELLCSFVTFVMSILWIYLLSNEIVALLASLGTILSLSKAIIGLTVLAWGNSLGDLFADVAIARAGYFRVAFTAVWTGPIQNLLLTLGITLLIGCFQMKPAGTSLSAATITLPPISPTIWLGFSFLLFSVVILSGVLLAFYYKFRLPLSLGIILITNFAVYLISSIILEWRMETE
ncbi:hypothetical protein K493DRAFT_412179 [Basidiobolus meristosporus CBS 931.73]|uniref:Sodium/calcium exchanger membrane region domain-containing protein n=1 Tax=Basidiobolus meristosporus CBS 931.73 TaxID=1314790 RepID=A0A1Y1X329_9FUNG|nr:hypothetical protein K493DRAFT_412179 [Basidiobolus meristosporus CBS 931.73]|eukprot:ORX80220.1 hypothetical protein K493DRAFT_412179 [Basidiobolus meristosporus CBS 931.73]